MKRLVIAAIVVGLPGAWQVAETHAAERMLAHDVYFTLKRDSDEAKEQLVAGCRQFLSGHPGVVWFDAGILVEENQRDLNDRDFDVALHLVFKNKASHDKYQDAPRHHKFIEEFHDNWKQVRVFDSYLLVTSHGAVEAAEDRPDEAKRPQLPDRAAGFAGMVRGEVVAKYDDGRIALKVEKVLKQWAHSKAADPESLLGKTVPVGGPDEDGRQIARFIKLLKVGQTIAVDVAHRGEGEALTILELSQQQRQQVRE
jgi:hypothetical protein